VVPLEVLKLLTMALLRPVMVPLLTRELIEPVLYIPTLTVAPPITPPEFLIPATVPVIMPLLNSELIDPLLVIAVGIFCPPIYPPLSLFMPATLPVIWRSSVLSGNQHNLMDLFSQH